MEICIYIYIVGELARHYVLLIGSADDNDECVGLLLGVKWLMCLRRAAVGSTDGKQTEALANTRRRTV